MNRKKRIIVLWFGVLFFLLAIAEQRVVIGRKVIDRQIGRLAIDGTLVFVGKGKWEFKIDTEIGDLNLNICSSDVETNLYGKTVKVIADIINRKVVVSDEVMDERDSMRVDNRKHYQHVDIKECSSTNIISSEVFLDAVSLNGTILNRAKRVAIESCAEWERNRGLAE